MMRAATKRTTAATLAPARGKALEAFAMLAALVLAFALALACAPGASAVESKGKADVSFSPDGWIVLIEASGPGSLELIDVVYADPSPATASFAGVAPTQASFTGTAPVHTAVEDPLLEAAPGMTVRDSSMRLFLARASTLVFRLEPDANAAVKGLLLDGADATARLGAGNTFSMAAEEASVSIEVVFDERGEDPGAGGGRPFGGFPLTGDALALAVVVLAAVAVAAGVLVRRACGVMQTAGAATDMPGILNAPDAPDPSDEPDAPDEEDAPEPSDPSDEPDAPDEPSKPDAPEPSDEPDAPDEPSKPDAPEPSDTAEQD